MSGQQLTKRRANRGDVGDWPFYKVVAIVRTMALESVEKRLQAVGVPGISVTKVKGYGEYADFFRADLMTEHARIEIFMRRARVKEVVRAVVAEARTGEAGDGLVVVIPVESIHRIRTGRRAGVDDLGGRGSRSPDESNGRHTEGNHG